MNGVKREWTVETYQGWTRDQVILIREAVDALVEGANEVEAEVVCKDWTLRFKAKR